MKSSTNRGIIRGVDIDKVVFCTPHGETETEESRSQQDKDNLKALEQYWYSKGSKDGHAKGFEEGFEEGKAEGYRLGLKEGNETGREEGLSEGLEKGKTEGMEHAQEELDQLVRPLTKAADCLRQECDSISEALRAELISLVLVVCEQIVRRELSDKEHYCQLIESLLKHASSILKTQSLDLVMAEDDLAFLREGLQTLQIDPELKTKIHLASDPNLERGDCRIETDLGLLNYDVKRQLEGLEKKLLELDHSQEESESEPLDVAPEDDHAEPSEGD